MAPKPVEAQAIEVHSARHEPRKEGKGEYIILCVDSGVGIVG